MCPASGTGAVGTAQAGSPPSFLYTGMEEAAQKLPEDDAQDLLMHVCGILRSSQRQHYEVSAGGSERLGRPGYPAVGQGECDGGHGEEWLWWEDQRATQWHHYLQTSAEGSNTDTGKQDKSKIKRIAEEQGDNCHNLPSAYVH